jgi:hypothetical protein
MDKTVGWGLIGANNVAREWVIDASGEEEIPTANFVLKADWEMADVFDEIGTFQTSS